MNTVLILLYLLAAFVVVATLLAILFPRRPLLGIAQHWGLQLWQLGLLGAIGGILAREPAAIALSAAAALYWSWRLWPRPVAPDAAADDAARLRLISANLLYKSRNFERSLHKIAASGADIVVLCEVTQQMRERLRSLDTRYPHALDTCAPDTLYGLAILSRFPLTLRSKGAGEDALPRHLAADFEFAGSTIALVAIHPTNPLRLSRAHRIPGEFEAVAALCRAAPEDLILTGDCNAAGWSRYLQDLERDAKLSNDRRLRPSWPIWLPPPVRLPLDHIWVRGSISLQQAELGPRLGSDHLPLIAEIRCQMPDVR
jgi:endonuclease/exonuclease/phosphatase (EEP) superfamily protein YafD